MRGRATILSSLLQVWGLRALLFLVLAVAPKSHGFSSHFLHRISGFVPTTPSALFTVSTKARASLCETSHVCLVRQGTFTKRDRSLRGALLTSCRSGARPSVAPLPIDSALPSLIEVLSTRGAAVLVAPPGSGKTTRVPPALLDAMLVGSGKIVLLQPRRVAARLAAKRIAEELGAEVGGEVGYRVRFDDRTSAKTRIEVVTEGLLTRRLAADPLLSDVDMVILDEFHERSLHTDLGLALLAALRRELRPELRLLVMSATLDPAPIQRFLADEQGDAPLIRADGRTFPINQRYVERPLGDQRLDMSIAQAVRAEAPDASGHTLVFLPGVGEIERVMELLKEQPPSHQPVILPLHGRLRPEAQDAALAPSASPKVVLSTNIAETSVTLEGVGLVIDSGLERRPVAEPATGLVRLETQPIARDSAEQRAGRAGRTSAGSCLRLWTEVEHRLRPENTRAAIHEEDLSGTLLLLLDMGEDPKTFHFFERPSEGALAGARATLQAIGAVDDKGITSLGREVSRLPIDPRFAALVVAGRDSGCLRAAAAAAALLSERDPWPDQADRLNLLDRITLLDQPARSSGAEPGAHRECVAVRDQLVAVAGSSKDRAGSDLEDRVIKAILAGFPERLARRREPGSARIVLANGNGATLDPPEQVPGAELLVAVLLQAGARGVRSEHKVRLAAPVSPGLLKSQRVVETQWDDAKGAVVVLERSMTGSLCLRERVANDLRPDAALAAALLEAAARRLPNRGLDVSRLGPLRGRLRLVQRFAPNLGLPTLDEAGIDALLPTLCVGLRKWSLEELQSIDLEQALFGELAWSVRASLDAQAPTHLTVPSGARIPLDYGDGENQPVLAARIQQLFGLRETPCVCEGRAPVLLHLLAPNGRPQQVTQDLMSFWRDGYPEVRKELRGRYPKHPWPDDPLTAIPVDRAQRRKPMESSPNTQKDPGTPGQKKKK